MADRMPSQRALRSYPRKVDISRAVDAARANGIRVASVTVNPDGSIKLSAIDDPATHKETLFDYLDKEGRL